MAGAGMPGDNHRISIVGRTGSGKTYAALWHLAMRSWHHRPWIVFDFKGDKNIALIPGLEEVDIKKPPPRKPGIYVVRPLPTDDDAEAQVKFMWKIWENEKTGMYIDEGYMVGKNNAAFRANLTQGRSKEIPMIILSQRPLWLDRFVWSEADFFQVFHLSTEDDRKVISRYLPVKSVERLPQYHSYYYDVGADEIVTLRPVPDRDKIITMIEDRLKNRRNFL